MRETLCPVCGERVAELKEHQLEVHSNLGLFSRKLINLSKNKNLNAKQLAILSCIRDSLTGQLSATEITRLIKAKDRRNILYTLDGMYSKGLLDRDSYQRPYLFSIAEEVEF